MKKLMIAAAAAAMVGGAYAATVKQKVAEYDFVANLTTTAGQVAPSSVSGSTTYNLGMNEEGWTPATKFWYQDDWFATSGLCVVTTNKDLEITAIDWTTVAATGRTEYVNLKFTKHYVDGDYVPSIENASANGELSSAEDALLSYLAQTYRYQSGGAWCCSVLAKSYSKGCYRTRGANRITKKVYLRPNCCTTVQLAFVQLSDLNNDGIIDDEKYSIDWSFGFLYRFGSVTSKSSTSLEMYAQIDPINGVWTSGYKTPVQFKGWLAGQGSWQTVKVGTGDERNLPTMINGSIVGSTSASLCDYCCKKPVFTGAYNCLTILPNDADYLAPTTTWAPRTAAFGTFYLQYRGIVEIDYDNTLL